MWAGTKPNLGLFPLQSGGEGTNAVVHVISQNQVDAGFALARTGANETHDFTMPAEANVHAPWILRGANRDRFALNSQTNAPWAFPLGTNIFDGLLVSSSGALVPKFAGESFIPRARRAWAEAARLPLLRGDPPIGEATLLSLPTLFAPFLANLGAVPQMNWPPPGEPGACSQFGWWLSPSNSLVLTWYDFLLNRSPDSPVSFQAEFFWRRFIDRIPWNIISVWQRQNAARANTYRTSGFMVQFRTDVSSEQIESSLKTDGLYRYTFTGHGDGDRGINSYPDPFDTVDPVMRYTKYGISGLTLQACGSAAIDEYGDNRTKGLVKRNNWECNVATVGFFIGYEGEVNLLNEVFQWTIVRGTNNGR